VWRPTGGWRKGRWTRGRRGKVESSWKPEDVFVGDCVRKYPIISEVADHAKRLNDQDCSCFSLPLSFVSFRAIPLYLIHIPLLSGFYPEF
jgi:hypothetical protein